MSHFWQGGSTDYPTVLIDLRKPGDFIASQIPGSYNLPLQSLNASTASPFFDAAVLEKQWTELDAMFSQNTLNAYDLAGKNIGVLCYDGDTARVATSVLRAKGIAASSITITRSTSSQSEFTRAVVKGSGLDSPRDCDG
jgi:rhodanese-related sulfurtransferase